MPVFNYEARTPEGEVRSGRVEASSKEVAMELLQRNNLVVIGMELLEAVPIYARKFAFFEHVSGQELVVFSRQLATLFQAEIPLVASLRTLAEQTEKALLKETINAIAADVDGGLPFSNALEKHLNVFSNFYVQMVRGGEASGKMDEVLNYLAGYEERRYHLNSQIRGSLSYPIFIIIVFLIIAIIMLIFVIPKLTMAFAQGGRELPLATKLLISASSFTQNFWYVIVLGIPALSFGISRYFKTPEGKDFWDVAMLRLPIIGPIARKTYILKFAESLSALLRGGVPIIQALGITADIVGNKEYKTIIKEAQEHVRRGETVGSTLRMYPQIPPLVSQMVSVGEQAGKLDVLLGNIANFYREEVDTSLKSISSLIQPVIIAVIAVGVGVLVMGILMPIYALTSSAE